MRTFPVTTDRIRQSKLAYTVAGVVLACLGVAAILAPSVTGEAIERIVGWLLLAGGVATGVSTWLSGREGWRTWLGLGGSLVAAAGGALLLWSPGGGGQLLTAVLVGYLGASGLAKVGVALFQRRSVPEVWPWLVASGMIDLVMATAVLTRFPFDAGWFLGLMLGISLLGTGILLVWIAWSGREIAG